MRILLKDLQPSTNYGVQFRSRNGGQVSDWSSTFNVTTINDTTPPPVPSTPVVAPYLGQLKVTWDGLGSAAEPMPNDFSYVEVHTSATSGFTPSNSTLSTTLKAKGDAIVSGLTYATVYYVKLISVDLVGNKSAASTQASGTPVRVSGLDVEALAIATTHLGDGAVTTAKIADATITSAKIGTAQILNANIANAAIDDAKIANVSAGKITTGSIQALQTIIAGDAAGAHVELTSTGMSIFGIDPEGGPQQIAQFGAGASDFLSIQDATGEVVASISQTGVANFTGASIDGWIDSDGDGEPDVPQPADTDPNAGFRIYGKEFKDWIDGLARGVVAWEVFGADSAALSAETGYGEIGAILYPDRVYRLSFRGNYESSVADGMANLRIRFTKSTSPTTDAASPTISSTALMLSQTEEGIAARDHKFSDFCVFTTGETEPRAYRFLLTADPVSGTTTLFGYGSGVATLAANDSSGINMVIEDIGPATITQSGQYNAVTGAGSGTTTPPPSTYTKTWTTNGSGTYKGSGVKRTDTNDVVQGYNSAHGDQQGLWTFSTSLQTTIASATVKKIEVYAYANHWYYNSGGNALIKVHGYTTPPASSPTQTFAIQSKNWPKPGGRWVTLPSSFYAGFKTGTYRGFGMGDTATTNLLYYGRFNGATASSGKAQIRVTYTK